jgi:hypothetical protein
MYITCVMTLNYFFVNCMLICFHALNNYQNLSLGLLTKAKAWKGNKNNVGWVLNFLWKLTKGLSQFTQRTSVDIISSDICHDILIVILIQVKIDILKFNQHLKTWIFHISSNIDIHARKWKIHWAYFQESSIHSK